MPAYNHVAMLGNLTRDPQLSYTPNQTAVVDFGLAINRKWRASDGSTREEVCFIDVRAFGGLAENINKYLKKGRLLLVDGHLAFETWTTQDGTKKSKHRLIAENAQFMPTANPQGSGQGNGGPEPDDIPI
jgi:single-strand DNA-binding protein